MLPHRDRATIVLNEMSRKGVFYINSRPVSGPRFCYHNELLRIQPHRDFPRGRGSGQKKRRRLGSEPRLLRQDDDHEFPRRLILHKTIHIIFKTHLDVGFTDYARAVVKRYHEQFIPLALTLARKLRERNGEERFVWTTGSGIVC
jgi:hypothetical protein